MSAKRSHPCSATRWGAQISKARGVQVGDESARLRDDIRLLGQLPGEVIRQLEGPESHELIEQIRRLSVAFRRDALAALEDAGKPRAVKSAAAKSRKTQASLKPPACVDQGFTFNLIRAQFRPLVSVGELRFHQLGMGLGDEQHRT
jgi:hypothetical protein